MKKLYTLAALAFASLASAQNLIPNGDLESWDNPTTPTSFTAVTSGTFSANNFLSQETTVHGGTYSAGHTSQSSTQTFGNFEIAVTPGHSYTISYWALDNDPNVRSRIWSAWITGTGATATVLTDNATELQPTTYSSDSPEWVQTTYTFTAPAAADHFRFQIRTYRQSTTAVGGKVFYDDLSFVDNSLATRQFDIAGLKVYPNPVKGGNLYITSDSNAVKTVTLVDVLGKQVLKTVVDGAPINVSNLNAGVYIVKVVEEGKTATRKLIIE